MKRKYEIYQEGMPGVDGLPTHRTIKTFKNEPEAMAFYNDKRNIRRYGPMFMNKSTGDGDMFSWDDRNERWVSA